MTVVRYSVAPRTPGPRSSLDHVLAAVDAGALAAFQDVTTRLSRGSGPLDFAATERDIRRAARHGHAPAVDAPAVDAPAVDAPAVVGVVRVSCPAVDRIMASRADDAENLATVMDARYLLVDGLGRPRDIDDAAMREVEAAVQSKALAYYAILLARQARLVRSARAAAAFCVEGAQDDREAVAVPSRVFLP
jgi:hypothetical protein